MVCEGKVNPPYMRLLSRGSSRARVLGKTVQVAESLGLGLPGGIKLTPIGVIWTNVT